MSKARAPSAGAPENPEPSNQLVAQPQRGVTQDLSVQDLLRQKRSIAELVKEVLIDGTHYGASFPGDTKKNLLQPGAESLLVLFGLVPRFTHAREDIVIPGEGMHREYTITCTLFTRAGIEVGSGLGSCSTMESKYRWRNDKRKCPGCGQPSIIKTNKGRNPGGYWCVPDKGGCGANYERGDDAIEGQLVGKVPNPDIADVYNTVLKIATKRAKVAATISCTGCSDMFSQDADDLEANISAGDDVADQRGDRQPPTRQQQASSKQASAPKQSIAPAAPGPSPAAAAASEQVNEAAQLVADLNAEYRTLKDRAGPKTASKFWGHWKLDDQRAVRLDAMRRANAALLAITGRLGAKADDILRDILQDRADPDNVPGILADLEKAAGPVPAAAAPSAAGGAKGDDEPPYAPIDARVSI